MKRHTITFPAIALLISVIMATSCGSNSSKEKNAGQSQSNKPKYEIPDPTANTLKALRRQKAAIDYYFRKGLRAKSGQKEYINKILYNDIRTDFLWGTEDVKNKNEWFDLVYKKFVFRTNNKKELGAFIRNGIFARVYNQPYASEKESIQKNLKQMRDGLKRARQEGDLEEIRNWKDGLEYWQNVNDRYNRYRPGNWNEYVY